MVAALCERLDKRSGKLATLMLFLDEEWSPVPLNRSNLIPICT